MTALDLATRKWWRTLGRRIDLDGEDAWLRAPTVRGSVVGDSWLASAAAPYDGQVHEGRPGAGLVASMADLDGPGFTATELLPDIRHFYEHTSDWRMEVWTGWNALFWPGGELVSRLFGKRVQQLALPMRPLEVARGMDSRVSVITDADGVQQAAGWLRTLRSTGEYVFSGCYSTRQLPGADRPSVHVAFPLESGNVQVFLRPDIDPDGSLWLRSPGVATRSATGDGAYVVVEDGGATYAARAPIHETFHVYADPGDRSGVLRTDHELKLWSADVVSLHYRLERGPAAGVT